MIAIRKVTCVAGLSNLKRAYLEQISTALDGMWLVGFAEYAGHFGFYKGERLIGYCYLNSDGYVLQFYLTADHYERASGLFVRVLSNSDALADTIRRLCQHGGALLFIVVFRPLQAL